VQWFQFENDKLSQVPVTVRKQHTRRLWQV
jgi:hypothetical protein